MPTKKRTEPKHGTNARYRAGCRCEKCRSASARAKRLQRARAKQRGGNPMLTIVGDGQVSGQDDGRAEPSEANDDSAVDDSLGKTKPRLWIGPVEKAVTADVDELDSTVLMHRTLRAMAIALAREIDDMEGKGSKAALHNQLLDVVTKLRGDSDVEEEGDNALFAALSQPLVPGAR